MNQREERCWLETHLAHLEKRGQSNCLTAFLLSVRRLIVPLLDVPERQLSLTDISVSRVPRSRR